MLQAARALLRSACCVTAEQQLQAQPAATLARQLVTANMLAGACVRAPCHTGEAPRGCYGGAAKVVAVHALLGEHSKMETAARHVSGGGDAPGQPSAPGHPPPHPAAGHVSLARPCRAAPAKPHHNADMLVAGRGAKRSPRPTWRAPRRLVGHVWELVSPVRQAAAGPVWLAAWSCFGIAISHPNGMQHPSFFLPLPVCD